MNRLIASLLFYTCAAFSQQPDRRHFVRIAEYGLFADKIGQIILSKFLNTKRRVQLGLLPLHQHAISLSKR